MQKRKTKYPMPSKMDQFRRRHRTAYSVVKASLLALAVALPVYLFAGKSLGLQITGATAWLTKQPGMVDVLVAAFTVGVGVCLLSIYRIIAMMAGNKVYVLKPVATSYEAEDDTSVINEAILGASVRSQCDPSFMCQGRVAAFLPHNSLDTNKYD
jgi:hypothetical protein